MHMDQLVAAIDIVGCENISFCNDRNNDSMDVRVRIIIVCDDSLYIICLDCMLFTCNRVFACCNTARWIECFIQPLQICLFPFGLIDRGVPPRVQNREMEDGGI